MWKQQEANAHGQPLQGQPLLYKQSGPAARQGYRLPLVQAARGVPLCTATLPAWKHLGHSETGGLNKVQAGHGGSTCRDLFTGLSPYMQGNRSTLRASRWVNAHHQEAQGIWWPAKQTAWHKRLCPKDEEALVDRLHKKREELGRLEDKVNAEMFRATFSSLYNKESPMTSRSILRDSPRPILEQAAGHSKTHSTYCVTKNVTGETPKYSELVSLDQLLAELCPVSDDSLSCNAPVKELLENREQEELPDREAAGQRDREPQSALFLPQPDKGCVLRDTSNVTRKLAAGSQGLWSTLGLTRDSARETENNTETAPPDRLGHLSSASGNEPSCDALLKELLEKRERGKLLGGAWAGEGDSEAESSVSLPLAKEDEESEPSTPDSDPYGQGHSEPLPRALPQEPEGFAGCASPADAKPCGCCGVM